MSLHIGSTNFGQIYIGSTRIGEVYVGSVKVYPDSAPDPYNPLNLPPFTVRFQFNNLSQGYDPTTSGETWKSDATWTQVSSSPNVWDYHRPDPDWTGEFEGNTWGIYTNSYASILGMNTTGITTMTRMLSRIKFMEPIPSFDISGTTTLYGLFMYSGFLGTREDHLPMLNTSHITSMNSVFTNCNFGNTSIHRTGYPMPDWDVSHVTDMSYMFRNTGLYGVLPGAIRIPSSWHTSSLTNMNYMFSDAIVFGLSNLDTSNVTSFNNTFCRGYYGEQTDTIYLIDTSSAHDVTEMYYNMPDISYGMYEMYQQLSANTNITNHGGCFSTTGTTTTLGQAARARIPTSWGGDMA